MKADVLYYQFVEKKGISILINYLDFLQKNNKKSDKIVIDFMNAFSVVSKALLALLMQIFQKH